MAENLILGKLSLNIITLLSLPYSAGTPILLSPGNSDHMKAKHPGAHLIYEKYLSLIISSPEYVGINTKDNSIEFVWKNTANGDYVKVAVRESRNSVLFIRSIYILNSKRVTKFIEIGQLKKV